MALSRISESSVSQDSSNAAASSTIVPNVATLSPSLFESHEATLQPAADSSTHIASNEPSSSTAATATDYASDPYRPSVINRKSSFDSASLLAGVEHLKQNQRQQAVESSGDGGSDEPHAAELSSRAFQSVFRTQTYVPPTATTLTANNSTNSRSSSIDPSQVFLQLFQPQNSNQSDKDKPMLIVENSAAQRALTIMDCLPCYLVHKIGITKKN